MKENHMGMEKAIHNLDIAIRLFIMENECEAAILIAGASEETFNDELKKQGKASILTLSKNKASKIYGISMKKVSDNHANLVKNWLKHATSPTLIYDEEEEAFQYIMRAIISYEMIFNKFEKSHYAFINYIQKNMPKIASYFDSEISKQMQLREYKDSTML
jgi:hypothetical protein